MLQNLDIVFRHLAELRCGYHLTVADDWTWFIVHGFVLPPGYNWYETDILVEVPWDYPVAPPGVTRHVFVSPSLRFNGRELADVHPSITPGWGHWAWWCYQRIAWNSLRDDFLSFMDILRTDMTNPPTK